MVQVSGFGSQVFGCRVQGSGFMVQGVGFRVQGFEWRVSGLGVRLAVWELGFKIRRGAVHSLSDISAAPVTV